MSDSLPAHWQRIANQLEASEDRCVASYETERLTNLFITVSREAIHRSRDRLARLDPIERPSGILSGR